jgi:hypothetical protein
MSESPRDVAARLYPDLCSIAAKMADDAQLPSASDDIAQEMALAVLESPDGHPDRWHVKAARRRAVRWIQAERRRQARERTFTDRGMSPFGDHEA